ncbi:MAG: GAF domain-containing protein [Anaerolineae bacterium]|nr:GAF domain-containing protein [Anaerolineae bacterium]MDW8297796.1 GAF domain-containing protein [Anaerolineae bacterium]
MRLAALFQLQRQFSDEIEQRQARALYAITLIMTFIAVLGIGIALIPAREQFATFRVVLLGSLVSADPSLFLPIVLIVCGLVLLLLQRGASKAARLVFVSGLLFAMVLLNFLIGDNTMQSRAIVGYVLPIVAASVLLSRSGMLVVTASVLTAILLQILAVATGVLDYPPTAPTPAYIPFILAVFAVTGSLLHVFGGIQRALLQDNQNRVSELSGIVALSRMVGEGASVDELLNATIALLHEKLGYAHVQLFLVEKRSGTLSLAGSTGILLSAQESAQRRLPPNSPSVIAEAARTGKTLRIPADAPLARRSEFAAGTRAELVIPLRIGEETLGVLDIQSMRAEAFSAQEIEGLESLALQLAFAIRSVRLQQALELAERDQQELIEQVRTASRDIERLNQEISGRAWQLYLQSRSEKVVSFDWNGNMITVGTKPIPLPTRGAYGYTPYIETREGAQYLVVPIVARGQALGVMEFRAPDGQSWDDRSVELARAVSQRLALSLDNLRLYEQAQMAITREQIANRVATLLQAKSDVDTLVAAAVDAFQQALGALQTSVRLGLPNRPAPSTLESNGHAESGAAS